MNTPSRIVEPSYELLVDWLLNQLGHVAVADLVLAAEQQLAQLDTSSDATALEATLEGFVVAAGQRLRTPDQWRELRDVVQLRDTLRDLSDCAALALRRLNSAQLVIYTDSETASREIMSLADAVARAQGADRLLQLVDQPVDRADLIAREVIGRHLLVMCRAEPSVEQLLARLERWLTITRQSVARQRVAAEQTASASDATA